jgi:hypothetical protein
VLGRLHLVQVMIRVVLHQDMVLVWAAKFSPVLPENEKCTKFLQLDHARVQVEQA